ncbi:MAG: twin-arginine translocation pathway signal [Vannielia sp.]|uniref:twin-arginine translocation pathway signal n=1 Tax=Rhodobacterales TaxID=204455 RepID=UPI0020948F14|nr:twin-arginine translocation pathway signal [Oceanicola sp. 502str15]MCO6381341.1 twin-arginine translocation pathway signal [Oceanicola sp. 502str15]
MPLQSRRSFLATASASLTAAALMPLPFTVPASAATLAPTRSMRGGANNYRPGAPLVESLGRGFIVHGKVLRAGDGKPLDGLRIQIWAATTLGGEREPRNHGSTLTRADGSFALEMEQILPNFGQPHAHLAYDDGAFQTVFLRPVMSSPADTSVAGNFVLAPA